MFVSFVSVDHSRIEYVLYRLEVQRVRLLLPCEMTQYLSSRHVVLPVLSLQHSQHEARIIVIALWDNVAIFLAVCSEVFKVIFFLFSEVHIHKDESLILSTLQREELFVHRWLEIMALLVELLHIVSVARTFHLASLML